ncbi:3 exoribonuclease domain 1 domain-containing protein, partial [Cystoisospora suis]
ERGVISCRVSLAKFSGDWRATAAGGGGGGEEREIAMNVRNILESVVFTEIYPRSHIYLFLHIVENDGGILPASICAASLALVDAG